MQAGTISRLRFCRISWGFNIYFGWNFVRFWKWYICSNKLDVQEANFSFTQFNKIRNHLFGCRIEVTRDSRFWFLCAFWEVTRSCQYDGCSRNRLQFFFNRSWKILLAHSHEWTVSQLFLNLVIGVFHCHQNLPDKTKELWAQGTCCIKPRQANAQRIKPQPQPRATVLMCFTLTQCFLIRNFLSQLLFCTCLRTIKRHKDDLQRQESNNETWFKNPQSFSWLVVWQKSFVHQESNQVCRHQTSTRRHFDKEISHAMSGTIFFICSSSAISALSAAPRVSAWLAAPKGWRKGCRSKKEKNRVVANSMPTTMNLTSSVAASSSSVNNPIAWRSLGILKASSRLVGLSGKLDANANQNSNPDAASSSQRWQRDAQLFFSTGTLVATDTDQNSLNRQEEPRQHMETRGNGDDWTPRMFRKIQNSRKFKRFKTKSRIWSHHFHVSPDWRKSSRS